MVLDFFIHGIVWPREYICDSSLPEDFRVFVLHLSFMIVNYGILPGWVDSYWFLTFQLLWSHDGKVVGLSCTITLKYYAEIIDLNSYCALASNNNNGMVLYWMVGIVMIYEINYIWLCIIVLNWTIITCNHRSTSSVSDLICLTVTSIVSVDTGLQVLSLLVFFYRINFILAILAIKISKSVLLLYFWCRNLRFIALIIWPTVSECSLLAKWSNIFRSR